jgi:hypothetical protein
MIRACYKFDRPVELTSMALNPQELAEWTARMNDWCFARDAQREAYIAGDGPLTALHGERAMIAFQLAGDVITQSLAREIPALRMDE